MIYLFICFSILFVDFLAAESEFEQYRQLRCTTPDGLTKAGPVQAKCHLILKDKEAEPGRIVPNDDQGCYKEPIKNATNDSSNGGKAKKGQSGLRILCSIVCPNASPWFHSPIEQGHKACFKGFGYGLEERDSEWYIWRSDKCLNSTATFTVGCKWRGLESDNFKSKFPNDKAIFANLIKIGTNDGK